MRPPMRTWRGAMNGALRAAALTKRTKKAALIHAQATIASDTDDAAALAVAGWVTIVLSKEHDMALNAIERALSLNPSCAMAHYYAALTNAFADRPTAVAFHANRALRLSPLDPANFEAHLALGMAAVGEWGWAPA
jgi:adenylate cyclase